MRGLTSTRYDLRKTLCLTWMLGFSRLTFGSSAADPSTMDLNEALTRLQSASGYRWSQVTSMGDAPFKVPSITGYQDPQGIITLTSTVDSKPVELVSRGSSRVIGSGSRWEVVRDRPRGTHMDPPDLLELLSARAPLGDLSSVKLQERGQPQSDGGYLAPLDTLTAASRLNGFIHRHAPVPLDSTSPQGTLRWWLKEGRLIRYVVTLNGTVHLPFGSKRVTIVSTTEITDMGPQPSAPSAAIAKLDLAGDPEPARR